MLVEEYLAHRHELLGPAPSHRLRLTPVALLFMIPGIQIKASPQGCVKNKKVCTFQPSLRQPLTHFTNTGKSWEEERNRGHLYTCDNDTHMEREVDISGGGKFFIKPSILSSPGLWC